MKKITGIVLAISFYQITAAQTNLQTVTTTGNTTSNAIRVTGEANVGTSGAGELVLGVLNAQKSNDTRIFIGWKGDAVANPTTNGPAGTLLLQARTSLANMPIDFVTGSTTATLRMRIAGDGNVLIGDNSLTSTARLLIKGAGATNATTSFLVQNSANTPSFRILDNGFVGAGAGTSTVLTQAKLGVFANAADATGAILGIERNIATGLIGGVRFTSSFVNTANANLPYWSSIEAYGTGGVDQMDLRFFTSFGGTQQNAERMRIDQFGRIGMGTTTPNVNARLDVNGNIFTNSKIVIGTTDMTKVGTYALAVNGDAIFQKARVKLFASWPDFVFEEKYGLLPIEALEKFIKKNKHLPNVPTAKQVEEEGIDLGATQTILLQKIEELTLYTIEQSKKNAQQQAQINQLIQQVELLQASTKNN